MTEDVNTGGLKKFSYPKNHKPQEDDKLKEFIEEAYEKQARRRYRDKIILSIILSIFCISLNLSLPFNFLFFASSRNEARP